MQGTGNDYIYLNVCDEPVSKPEDLARRLSERRFGIGSDGLVLIGRGETADLSMRMFNADGSEAEMCGNAIRCVARYGFEHGLVEKTGLSIETLAGTKKVELILDDWGRVASVRVGMGVPELDPKCLPAIFEGPRFIDQLVEFEGFSLKGTLVSMGNPHFVTFVEDLEKTPVELWGPIIEKDPRFPKRINIEFVQVTNKTHAKQRTWERGSGETLSCGTGASAALVAGILTNRLVSPAVIELLGGKLSIEWPGEGSTLLMSGEAVEVFEGQVEV